MKFSRISIIAVILVMIAVAIAGCTGSTQPSSTTGTAAPTGSGSAAPASTAVASAAASDSSASGTVSGSQVLGGVTYEWVEYKITSNAGGEKISMYFKYNEKTGKCTMRIEGMEDQTGMFSNMDCSSSGSTSAGNDPNDIGSDVKMTKIGTESVTVPAGTFVADKYMVTSDGVTATYWIASGKPLLKMDGSSTEGSYTSELSGWG